MTQPRWETLTEWGLRYRRRCDDFKDGPRGEVHILDETGGCARRIPAYGHIARVYRLQEGLRRFFGREEFFVEEKIDGYNIRIIRHDADIYALTRGGFLCPWTTHWCRLLAEEWGLNRLFRRHPRAVVCAEVAGDNPYNPQRDPRLPEGPSLFVFDLWVDGEQSLSPQHRYDHLNDCGLPGVPVLGVHRADAWPPLRDLMVRLNEAGSEGAVFKGARSNKALKFVTPNKDLDDIRDNLIIEFDLHPRFFRNRLLRSFLFVEQMGLNETAFAHRLGEAVVSGYAPLKHFEHAAERFTVHVVDPSAWDQWRRLIETGGEIKIVERSRETAVVRGLACTRIVFERVYPKSTRRYRDILKGIPHID